ncbi:SMI1 / KNR4 family protein [Gimesia panareensis]|uniref:SMI1 / KNR4 family protein n=1 Tax=Gimesia panareensis TaxID=2527978 RepID=A0A517PZM0_9PLAN|nr:SMI1/KNR4 family protein [Gimesia panareensis]QDT24786.1 SMI1 / KNR4 family protein [Gimesia panareensis]QDV15465.1 SMI1 / KNR4 family protein [Gimesia panareensis]
MLFPVEERFIHETEKRLGLKLPPDYVNKMMKANGGEVQTTPDAWVLYPIFDTSDKKRLKRTCNDVVRETESARDWVGFPDEAVAIGSNGCGDQLVLLRDKKSPEVSGDEVFWWDHETGALNMVAARFADLTLD